VYTPDGDVDGTWFKEEKGRVKSLEGGRKKRNSRVVAREEGMTRKKRWDREKKFGRERHVS